MDTLSPFASFSKGTEVIEGYSVGLFARICGALYFLFINPLFIYVWIDSPKFVQGPIDFPEIFMGIVTVGMLFLGCCGLMVNFAKTRVSANAIEWRTFRHHRFDLDRLRYVDRIVRLSVFSIPVISIMWLVSDESKKIEIAGDTDELYQSFLWLQSQYPS